jgi:Zn-dependent protease
MSYSSQVGPAERIDLLLSWVVLVIGFSIVMGGRRVPSIDLIVISALGVGTGFLLHELAHKFIAQRYGYWAEYRANRSGLLLIIIVSLMGFILAAPGAVMIHKASNPYPQSTAYSLREEVYVDRRKVQKELLWISLAGPMTNIILAALFYGLLASGIMASKVSMNAIYFAFFINLYLAAFNLIPFGPLDGRKIFEVNRLVWAIVAVPTITMALSLLFGRGIT